MARNLLKEIDEEEGAEPRNLLQEMEIPEPVAPAQQEYAAPRPVGEPSMMDRVKGTAGNMLDIAATGGKAVSRAISGYDQETRATRDLPELSAVGIDAMLGPGVGQGDKMGVSAALATTFDVEEAARILRSANPALGVSFDEKGNVMVTNNETGVSAVINKPGLSGMDAIQGTATAAAFTPAARGGSAIGVGLKSAGTQAAVESGQVVAGGDFDPAAVLEVGAGGAAFQGLFNRLAQSVPVLRAPLTNVTDEVRNLFRAEAVKVGIDPSAITDDMIRAASRQAGDAANPQALPAVAGEAEFGIPLSRGQRTGDESQIEFEDLARTGTFGEDARAPLVDLRDRQRNAAQAARGDVADQIAGPAPVERQPTGGVVRSGIQERERVAREAVDDAYSEVSDASLGQEGYTALLVATRKALVGEGFDRTLPETAKVLGEISKRLKLDVGLQAKGAKPRQVSLKQIDQQRKRLNTAIEAASANPADRRQLVVLKRAFDDKLDDLVINGLFSGDEQALSQLKSARALYADYVKKFRTQPTRLSSGRNDPDPAGLFIEKIVDSNPTNDQIVNAVFGASSLNKQSGAIMAQRFKAILGEGSEEWNSIRRAAFDRIVQTNKINGQEVISGQKTMSALDKAMENNGDLLKELFTGEEISLMRRFASQVQRTDPMIEKSRLQPSGNIRALRQIASRLGGSFDLTLGIVSEGVQRVTSRNATQRASAAASRPFEKLQPARAGLSAGAVGATQSAMAETTAPEG